MFQDTPNKQAIRTSWNRPLIEAQAKTLSRELAYFGMPGAELRDILDWVDLLKQKTCVQIVRPGKAQKEEDLETVRQLNANVMTHNIRHVQILRGAVEDVIIRGQDMDGAVPRQAEMSGDDLLFRYDLINLDFVGGMGYKSGRAAPLPGAQRLKSFAALLRRQQGHDFLFLLTVNVRDTLGDEPSKYLLETAQRCQNATVQEVVRWTTTLDDGLKQFQLRTWVPIYLKEQAEMHQFACTAYPPICYEGHERAKMVHFAFHLRFAQGRDLRVASPQSEEQVVSLPVLEARDGHLWTVNPADGPLRKPELIDSSAPLDNTAITELLFPRPIATRSH